MIVEDVMRECNNFFITDKRVLEKITIKDNVIINSLDFLDGQYIWILHSVFNTGVYKFYGKKTWGDLKKQTWAKVSPSAWENFLNSCDDELIDEEFNGEIVGLAPPRAFLQLCEDIKAWRDKYGNTLDSPFTSESFGGYSYTKASGTGDSSGTTGVTWQAQFKSQLNKWRKI